MATIATSPKLLKEAEKEQGGYEDDSESLEGMPTQEETCAQPNAQSIQAGGNVKEGVKEAIDTVKEAAHKAGQAIKNGAEAVEDKAQEANTYMEEKVSEESRPTTRVETA